MRRAAGAQLRVGPHADHTPRHHLAHGERRQRERVLAEHLPDPRIEDDLPQVAVGDDADQAAASVHDR
jgi:hypothetical protein